MKFNPYIGIEVKQKENGEDKRNRKIATMARRREKSVQTGDKGYAPKG